MCDLHSAAEELRRIEAAVAEQFAAIPKLEAPDRPSERVENAATALLVALPIAVLILGPPLS
jgi:hypothetical protein